ncbi:MAG: putative metallopeptidase [Candidatus Aenigmarchaeota archaeon]|nr:putative metallopeptidase [Candidatus Aenigmarchaeota archaeon]
MIKYSLAPDIEAKVRELAGKLGIKHDFSRVVCIRSRGSTSRRTLARCHALPRVMQVALNVKAHYVIEVISENFDVLSDVEKTKTLIHELLHIPKAFGGGFKYHNYANRKNVDILYERFVRE